MRRSSCHRSFVQSLFAAAVAVCDRAILIKSVMELWGEAATHKELAQITKDLPRPVVEPYLASDVSWSITVDAFGLSLNLERQETVRSHYQHLAFQGPVKCKEPDQMFWAIERHAPLASGNLTPESVPESVYFGREVARSLSRRLVSRCDLKQRKYLGAAWFSLCKLSDIAFLRRRKKIEMLL